MDPIAMPDIDLRTSPFDKISYHMNAYDPHTETFHTHDGLEIGHIIHGHGHVIIENQIFGFQPGAITLINGRLSHCTRPDNREEYCRNKIHFSAEYLLTILRSMGNADLLLEPFFSKDGAQPVMQLSTETSDKIDHLFCEMEAESLTRDYGCLPAVTALLIQILTLISRHSKHAERRHPPNALFQHTFRIIDYVGSHLETFNLNELSKDMFLSKYYLCHSFKKATGTTIWQYVLNKKIDRAKELLTNTTLPISQVAMDLGFSSFSLFSRSFKRFTGQSPSEFRKN